MSRIGQLQTRLRELRKVLERGRAFADGFDPRTQSEIEAMDGSVDSKRSLALRLGFVLSSLDHAEHQILPVLEHLADSIAENPIESHGERRTGGVSDEP